MTTMRPDAPHPLDPEAAVALFTAHAIPGAEHTDRATATHTRLISTADGPVRVDITPDDAGDA
ncbi:hypothetical protein [Rhodococcus sp. NPDC059234]|uniref:hypothetical protein n=1 Tax=Rhodococcus sp. NPDC059234 TaxID=3346781 RepID=UPI00366CF1EB